MENNNYYYGTAATQQQPTYYDPMYFGYQPYTYNNVPAPQNVNALTDEEIKTLRSARPTSKIDLNIDRNDVLRAMCTHKDHGKDMVVPVNDESGDVWCPICGARWNPNAMTKEEIVDLVETLIGQMENAKWTGDLPVELTRELFTLIPLLRKFPDVYEYALNTFNKYYSQRGMVNAQDTSVYAQYNALLNPGYAYGAPIQQPGYYGQPQGQPQGGYYYGTMPPAGAPQMNQGAPAGQPQMANPAYNPMQMPYGVSPAAPNMQFNNQANMMMGGSIYGQPVMPGYYGQPNGQQMPNGQVAPNGPQQAAAPAGQPQQAGQPAQYAPTFATPNAGDAKTTNNQDGTTTSETKIDL